MLEAAGTAHGTLDAVRALSKRLRPEVLDELGLVPALTNLCDRLSHRTGLPIHHDLHRELPPLAEDAQLVIYRVAQESLTNVVRHAHARNAEVRLSDRGDTVELVVADDGVGLPDPSELDGGVRSMRERAVLVGGQLTLADSASGGALVSLRVPCEDAPAVVSR